MTEVLFVCVHNAGRSQMVAALLHHHAAGQDAAHVRVIRDGIGRRVRALLAELH